MSRTASRVELVMGRPIIGSHIVRRSDRTFENIGPGASIGEKRSALFHRLDTSSGGEDIPSYGNIPMFFSFHTEIY